MSRPKRVAGVYTITCKANGRQYVGSAAYIRNRWSTHRWALRHGQHRIADLQADWDEYGEAAFEFRTVAEVRDPKLRRAAEQACLDQIFGTGSAYNRSPSTNGNGGIKFTADQCLAMSLARKGAKFSPGHRLALSEALKRRYAPVKGTAAMRDRMAAMGRANLGKPKAAETRARMARAQERLTADQVAEVRARYAAGGVKQQDLAEEYGVHQGTISNVVRGKNYGSEPGVQETAGRGNWGHGSYHAKLDEDKVREIKRRLAAGETGRSLAAAFGITPAAISNIKRGRTWAHIT